MLCLNILMSFTDTDFVSFSQKIILFESSECVFEVLVPVCSVVGIYSVFKT